MRRTRHCTGASSPAAPWSSRCSRPDGVSSAVSHRKRSIRAALKNNSRWGTHRMTRHLWSGRFDTPPDATTFEWGSSFSFDRRLFEDDVRGSLAWARGLARAGVLTADDAHAIEAALTAILER